MNTIFLQSFRHSTMYISCWPCFGQFDRDAHIPALKFVLVIFIFLMYLVLGASIFSTIEGPSNEAALANLTELKEQFFQQNKKCISGKFLGILLWIRETYVVYLSVCPHTICLHLQVIKD